MFKARTASNSDAPSPSRIDTSAGHGVTGLGNGAVVMFGKYPVFALYSESPMSCTHCHGYVNSSLLPALKYSQPTIPPKSG